MIEIERKFLIKPTNFETLAQSKQTIAQGYLNRDASRTVRVRLKNDKGYLTIKGQSNASGTSRFEWEKEIDFQDAKPYWLCVKITSLPKRVTSFPSVSMSLK